MMYLGKDAVAIAKETGAQFVKGSFTVPNDASAYYTLDFGKSFSRYLFLVEMDDASKTMLSNSGISANRIYAEQGIFPMPSINDVIPTSIYLYERINPETQAVSVSQGIGGIHNLTASSIQFRKNAITTDQSYLYNGYTYNYYIVEIK